MVRPVVVGAAPTEVLGLVVGGSLARIDDPVSVGVPSVEEVGDLLSKDLR